MIDFLNPGESSLVERAWAEEAVNLALRAAPPGDPRWAKPDTKRFIVDQAFEIIGTVVGELKQRMERLETVTTDDLVQLSLFQDQLLDTLEEKALENIERFVWKL